MKTPRPGLRRFSFSAKNSSFATRATPPTRAAARSTKPGGGAGVESAALMSSAEIADPKIRETKLKSQSPNAFSIFPAVLKFESCLGFDHWDLGFRGGV